MAIRSLADLRAAADDSNNESRGTSSFSGGERSGLAIQNPENGFPNASYACPSACTQAAHLHRHHQQGATNQNRAKAETSSGARRVIVYSNGFCVDDGEFRPFGVEANDAFVQELKAGVAPRELQEGGREVHVLLDDRHEETYTPPPPPQYVLFGGEGQSLSGGAASAAVPAAAVDMSRAAAAAEAAEAADPGAPRTRIMFRLHDGQRTAQLFAETATVQQLFDFVNVFFFLHGKVTHASEFVSWVLDGRVAPAPGGFELLEGFPPKPVSAPHNSTLKDAGLLNATLSQKLS